ncbi:hypothetical protein CLOM_g12083 [Closterium sp. NIES-68]|nr:hypothetical protein CLOM_g11094 [Closterium sp. NIES-68]GJP76709.1 hypothetical protein CLOP_g7175 [Closterium sp. NIES-67]GJP52200.1 hypothetical protein CLOM_g11347 [Closterium sp. NIES-68]GJP52605.1 hypothetical protein CLOM_g11712 [Closterium sp. NIES-68]GJP52922.1 hypothetical protein CLOM_g12083 [Closterium sp. NIES-68]
MHHSHILHYPHQHCLPAHSSISHHHLFVIYQFCLTLFSNPFLMHLTFSHFLCILPFPISRASDIFPFHVQLNFSLLPCL